MKGDHDAQNVVTVSTSDKAVFSNKQAIIPDYDEIKDESNTEKLSEKLHQEKRSPELTKPNNNYFTLMPQDEQESISKVRYVVICLYYTCISQ